MSGRFDRACLRVVAISGGTGDPRQVLVELGNAIEGGVTTVIVREPGLLAHRHDAAEVTAALRRSLPSGQGLLLWSAGGSREELSVIAGLPCDGVQLRADAPAVATVRASLPETAVVGCSVHDGAEIESAADADHVILAPIFPTASKPGHRGLGVERAKELTARATPPVVWLGGVDESRLRGLRPPLPCCGFGFLHRWASTSRQETRALIAEVAAILRAE